MFEKKTSSPFYTPLKIEGEGSFGVVIRAKDQHGRIVAIKKVKKSERYSSREVDILLLLNAIPNCVHMLDMFHTMDKEDKIIQNIVFEFVPGSLENYLNQHVRQQRHIEYTKIQHFMKQICCCLRDVHKMNICHRDLKPDNILIDDNLNVKICDFGSAKIIEKKGGNITRIVARCYRPPEISFASPDYNSAVDMWTTGCILYELMTLHTAFEPQSDSYIFFEHCQMLGVPSEKEKKVLFNNIDESIQRQLNNYCNSKSIERIPFYDQIPNFYSSKERKEGAALLEGLMRWDPKDRLTAKECLQSGMLSSEI